MIRLRPTLAAIGVLALAFTLVAADSAPAQPGVTTDAKPVVSPSAVNPQVRKGAPVETSPLPRLPKLAPLFDVPLRDTSICVGHDGAYYMTGTTGWPDWWAVTADLQVWRSENLRDWHPVIEKPRPRSIVWNVDRDGTWEKQITLRDGAPFRPLWAPEIAYLKGTYWICYSLPRGIGGGILKSTTGQPEGPYEAMFKDQPAVTAIDLALFEDDDGKVYLLWGAGNIRELNAEMNGFVGEGWKLTPADAERIGFEGTFVFKKDGRYYISGAEFVANPDGGEGADYHCYAASGPSLRGPFSDRYLAIPHAGHNSFFRDRDGVLWATFFGNDPRAPFRERPGILRAAFTPDGKLTYARE